MLTKIHHAIIDGLSGAEIMGVLFDLEPDGATRAPGTSWTAQRRQARRPRDARARPASACPATRCGCCGRCPPRCRTSTRPRSGPCRAPTRSPASPSACAARCAGPARAASSSAPRTSRRAHRSTGASRRTGASSSAGSRWTGQGGQERPRLHRQRRRRLDLRRRGAPLADRARRAAGGPAGRPDPGLGALRATAGDLRQPDHADERAAVHQRRRPGRAPARDARCPRVDEGAPPGDAGRPAAGREPLHPPGGVRARRAGDLRARERAVAAGPPGTS